MARTIELILRIIPEPVRGLGTTSEPTEDNPWTGEYEGDVCKEVVGVAVFGGLY